VNVETPAHDAVAAAQEEQANTPTEVAIEVPDMHPDAALEAARKALTSVNEQITDAGLPPVEVPAIGPGTEQWEAVGGSIQTTTTGNDPEIDLLVIRIVYIPDIAATFIKALLTQIMANASIAPRGSQPHEALLAQAHGHPYDDGLPDKETLEDKKVETMGGKGDTVCPDCGNDLSRSQHRTDCPRNQVQVPPFMEKP
jgi:hypothetical protein